MPFIFDTVWYSDIPEVIYSKGEASHLGMQPVQVQARAAVPSVAYLGK